MSRFMFATGIENSNPTIDDGRIRADELEKCHFYTRWREDFELVQDLGIRFLRFGPPLHRTFLGPDRFDWEFGDLMMRQPEAQELTPIVDLCHFDVPDGIGNFQDPGFPRLLADCAMRQSLNSVRWPTKFRCERASIKCGP